MKHVIRCAVMLWLVITLTQSAVAQISAGGNPRSFNLSLTADVPTAPLQTVDIAAYIAEDALAGKDEPYRFGADIDVSFNMQNSGIWTELPDGGRLWQLRIASPGAYSINLLFDQWYIPDGADLFIYNDDRSQVIGAFTNLNNWVDGTNITQPVAGDAITLEYYEPESVRDQGVLSVSRVVHAYRNIFGFGRHDALDNYGDSGSCNNNVNCPEGAAWQGQKRGVAMILSGGSRICTGSLINNVRQNRTPYFLTANHCLGGESSWVFMFNYESPTCTNANGPTNQTVANATLRASNSASDFALLQLSASVPVSYNPYFNGWSNINTVSTSSVCIHHPSGDIKKITFDNNAPTSSTWSGTPANSHWRILAWDDGTTEPGSSGSPLFDQNHRITGQLHGGTASCLNNIDDYFGKFSMSWNYGGSASTRLVDWLDPDATGATTLDGLEGAVSITVTAPNGGETLIVGDPYTMTWTSVGLSENVKIELNRSYSGGTWETLVASTANDGSYAWTVTSPTTTTARIRVTGVTQTTVTDVSDANFSIGVRALTVTSPNGGETAITGENYTVTWTSQNLADNVKIELNRSYSGGAWETIIASTANSGSYIWPVSGSTTFAARIRITGVAFTGVTDVSDANFTIAARTIAVTSPNGGENWISGSLHNITWTSANVTGNVNIELNRSYSGGTWESLAAGATNNGTFGWTVTTPATATARVRVTSVSYPAISDVSNANFTISAPNQPPTLTHDALDDQLPIGFTVTAKAADDVAVIAVRMAYKLITAPAYDSLNLAATGNPAEYAATVGPLAIGSYRYFIRALDGSGLSAVTDTFSFDVGESCGTERAYDDGVAEAAHWSEQIGYQWAVRFDAGPAPFMLCRGRIGVSAVHPDSAHSPISVAVYLADGAGGMPGTQIFVKEIGSIGNVIGGTPADPASWAEVVFKDESGNPLVLTESFYVAVSNPIAGKFEAFLHDTSSALSGRSVVYDPCDSVWVNELSAEFSARRGNRMIRVSGLTLAAPNLVIAPNGTDLILTWNSTGAPFYRVYSATSASGPYETLEGSASTTSLTDVNGVNEGNKFYLVVSSTTP